MNSENNEKIRDWERLARTFEEKIEMLEAVYSILLASMKRHAEEIVALCESLEDHEKEVLG